MKQISTRLKQRDDLKSAISELARSEELTAAVVVCSVGSLSKVNLRLAGAMETLKKEGEFEIISLNGRIAKNGEHLHLHLSVADSKGVVIGGHMLDGCVVRTTVELVLLSFDDVEYTTEIDEVTGYKELIINSL